MEPALFYTGIVADAYARLKASTFQAGPYAEFITTHGEPSLELGCGDGEPLLELRTAGLDVDGVDSSADMVNRCRANATRRGITVSVFHQRIEAMTLDRRYASIFLAGPTFTLLADDETASQALRAIEQHLTGDGAALIPLWVPDPTPDDELGVSRTALDGPDVELRYTPVTETYDAERRTRVTTARYERVTPQGTERADREWVIHWHTPESFTTLCAAAGLEVLAMVDDHTAKYPCETSKNFTVTVRRSTDSY